MNGITVFMALVDFIPVVLFFISAVVLQRDLYNRLVKGAYALLAGGSIMVLTGGIYKALWKILYALGICDWKAINEAFFPITSIGFLLCFLSLAGSFSSFKKGTVKLGVSVVPVMTSSLPFIIIQVLGLGGTQICLLALAKKTGVRKAIPLFVLSFIAMLGMGYLGAKFDDSSGMHWMAQIVNIVSNAALLAGVLMMHQKQAITPRQATE